MVARTSVVVSMLGVLACGRVRYAPADGEVPPFVPCSPTAIVCEDFESGLGAFVRTDDGDGDTLSFTDSPVRVGRRALRMTSGSDGNGYVAARAPLDPPLTSGLLYGRAMLWVGDSTVVQQWMVVLELDDSRESGEEKISIDLHPDEALSFVLTTAEPSVFTFGDPGSLPFETWMCMTFAIDIGDSGSAAFDRDGRRVATFSDVDTVPPGGFTQLLLGMSSPVTGVVGEVVLDAVALDRAPLGCPP